MSCPLAYLTNLAPTTSLQKAILLLDWFATMKDEYMTL